MHGPQCRQKLLVHPVEARRTTLALQCRLKKNVGVIPTTSVQNVRYVWPKRWKIPKALQDCGLVAHAFRCRVRKWQLHVSQQGSARAHNLDRKLADRGLPP